HQHAAAQHGFADVGAGVIRDAAHDIEPGGDASDPDLAGGEKARQAGGITVGLLQELFKFRDFKREFGVHFPKCSGHVSLTLPENIPEVTPEKSMVMMPEQPATIPEEIPNDENVQRENAQDHPR